MVFTAPGKEISDIVLQTINKNTQYMWAHDV